MLPRPDRLRLSRDIDRVYRGGRSGRGEALTVKALRRPSGSTRAVVIVGKKVSKRAVVRNRNRRRLVEILAAEWQRIAAGYDIVVTVHRDAAGLSAAQLSGDLTASLKRAGVLA